MSNLAIKQSAFAGLKRDFDISLSKKLCPPVLNNQGQTFVKRIVTSVDNIIEIKEGTDDESYQPREQINVISNVNDLTPSFRYNGWLHDQRPLSVEPSKSVKGKYVLRRGFNRLTTVRDRLGWRYIIVDVYEPSSNVTENILYKYQDNNNHLPGAKNKDVDYIKGAVEWFDTTDVAPEDDKAIIKFLTEIVKNEDGVMQKTKEEVADYVPVLDDNGFQIGKKVKKGCLLYKFRLQRGKTKSLVSLDGTSANKLLHSLGRPWAGDKGLQSDDNPTMDIGYAFESTNSLHRIMWDGAKYFRQYRKPIWLFGYVQNPTSETLMSDRLACKEHYEFFLKECETRLGDMAMSMANPKKAYGDWDVDWKYDDVFVWGGFLPQDKSIDENGNQREKDIII